MLGSAAGAHRSRQPGSRATDQRPRALNTQKLSHFAPPGAHTGLPVLPQPRSTASRRPTSFQPRSVLSAWVFSSAIPVGIGLSGSGRSCDSCALKRSVSSRCSARYLSIANEHQSRPETPEDTITCSPMNYTMNYELNHGILPNKTDFPTIPCSFAALSFRASYNIFGMIPQWNG